MRFKAKLATDQVSLLYNVITPISKLQDSHRGAVMYLDREFIRISCKSENGITCFAELSKDIFLEHRIESAADNVIVCQVDLLSLKQALASVVSHNPHQKSSSGQQNNNNISAVQSLLGQQMVILKLAKRNQLPCLCLDGHAQDSVEIHQAIPVRILRHSEMQYHLPPQINTPQVQLELPLERPLRAVVEKLRSMGPHGTYTY
jgi:HUS1 checkpoint protein